MRRALESRTCSPVDRCVAVTVTVSSGTGNVVSSAARLSDVPREVVKGPGPEAEKGLWWRGRECRAGEWAQGCA